MENTGEIRWEYEPPGQGALLRAQPALSHGRLFIGDHAGRFCSIDAKTGNVRWRRTPSRPRNNGIDCMAFAVGARVFAANNAGAVLCLDAASGSELWRHELDGAGGMRLERMGSRLIAARGAIQVLNMRTGALLYKVGFSGQEVYSLTVAGRRVVAVLGPEMRQEPVRAPERFELIAIEDGLEVNRRRLRGISCVRTCLETGLVYCVNPWEELAVDPSALAVVRRWPKFLCLPDCRDATVYCLTHDGTMFASRM